MRDLPPSRGETQRDRTTLRVPVCVETPAWTYDKREDLSSAADFEHYDFRLAELAKTDADTRSRENFDTVGIVQAYAGLALAKRPPFLSPRLAPAAEILRHRRHRPTTSELKTPLQLA